MRFFAILSALALTFVLAGCEPAKPTTAQTNAAQVEANQQRLQVAQPAPVLSVSIERRNLVERLKRLNTENMSGYVYLLDMGRVVASYPTKGKPTSLNAYLMAGEKSVRYGGGESLNVVLEEQPDYDGAYGENVDGIFFFTADTNAYVEWRGPYLFSDQPLSLNGQPLMMREVKD